MLRNYCCVMVCIRNYRWNSEISGESWGISWGQATGSFDTNHGDILTTEKGCQKNNHFKCFIRISLSLLYHIYKGIYIYIIGYDSQQILVGSCWVCLKMDSGLNFWRLLNEHQWTSMNINEHQWTTSTTRTHTKTSSAIANDMFDILYATQNLTVDDHFAH